MGGAVQVDSHYLPGRVGAKKRVQRKIESVLKIEILGTDRINVYGGECRSRKRLDQEARIKLCKSNRV